MTIQFPAHPVDDSGNDISAPVVSLLEKLSILSDPTELEKANGPGAVISGPPQSVAIIESGATALSKWWSAGLGATLTGGTILTAVTGFWAKEHDPVRIALIAGAAFFFGAVALAIGIMVSSDVRARGSGAVAQIRTRGEVATTFLTLSRSAANGPTGLNVTLTDALLAAVASGSSVRVTLASGAEEDVMGLRYNPTENAQIQIGDGDWVSTKVVQAFTTA
jgi:hypothetical protein